MLGFFKGKTKEKVICSPCVGNVTPLTEVPDPTFSENWYPQYCFLYGRYCLADWLHWERQL